MSPRTALTTPPLLQGAALLFWGWQTGQHVLAVVLAVLVEALPRLGLGFSMGPREYGRFADLCVLLLLGEALYLFLTPGEASALLQLGRWAPLTLAPLALAQALGGEGRISLAAFFSTLRRRRTLERKQPRHFAFGPVFVLATLFAAGCGNARTPFFFFGAALLGFWLLYALRPRRFAPSVWVAAALLVLGAGYVGQWSIHEMQEAVRGWVRRDPFKSTTAIGQLGELKLSERIVLRVASERPLTGGLLLHEASYDFYSEGTWHATDAQFTELASGGGDIWRLRVFGGEATGPAPAPRAGQQPQLTVYQSVPWRGALLALPQGSFEIGGLPAGEVGQNRLGAVKVDRAPRLVAYTADYAPGLRLEAPPTVVDRVVPPRDRDMLRGVVRELGLMRLPPQARAERLETWFHERFGYSLRLEPPPEGQTPLAAFLQGRRSGHCEYFAMAAVFLLRQAGIPARYATGYAVQEFLAGEGMYVVRERHAHAWALAWLHGGWAPVDATPPVWWEEEAGEYTWLERLSDLRQRLAFNFERWRWLGQDARTRRILLWTAGPLLLFLLYRLLRTLRLRRSQKGGAVQGPGEDFSRVEARLRRRGIVRGPSEPLAAYLRRAGAAELLPALRLYYARRFDPQGLDAAGQQELQRLLRQWLREPAARKRRS